MYKNIGSKIKGVIEIVTIISFAILFIVAVVGLIASKGELPIFVFCGIVALGIWVTNLVVYAIGQITENTDKNESSNEDFPMWEEFL